MSQAARAKRWEGKEKSRTLEELLSPRSLLLLATAILLAYGVIMTYSVQSVTESSSSATTVPEILATVMRPLLTELVYLAAGLVIALGVSHVSPRFFTHPVVLVVVTALSFAVLAITLVAGSSTNGATRWLPIGSFRVQPSEFVKIVMIALAAYACALMSDDWHAPSIPFIIAVGGVVILALTIMIERDLGTLIIVFATIWCVCLLGRMPRKWLIGVIVVGLVLGIVFISTQSYRMGRVAAWMGDVFNDESLSSDDGYQLKQGLYALGSGGYWGLGLGSSRLKYGYLTQSESDFIFCILGEELGFVRGTLPVILSFGLFGWAGLQIAKQAKGRQGDYLLAAGLTACIVIQAFINIGGAIKLIPETGRTLPFISSGGSSLVASLAIVGILLAIDRQNRRDRQQEERERLAERRARSRRRLNVIEGGLPGTMAPAASVNAAPSQGAVSQTRRQGSRPEQTRGLGSTRGSANRP